MIKIVFGSANKLYFYQFALDLFDIPEHEIIMTEKHDLNTIYEPSCEKTNNVVFEQV